MHIDSISQMPPNYILDPQIDLASAPCIGSMHIRLSLEHSEISVQEVPESISGHEASGDCNLAAHWKCFCDSFSSCDAPD